MSVECRLAAHLHLPMVRVRRAPLALVLLWMNYAVQAEGMETWWLTETAARKDGELVRSELAALRAEADGICAGWVE